MSLIPGYSNDVFISYSRLDNQSARGEDKGWVDILHERLVVRLSHLLGERPTIWRDSELLGNLHFAEANAINLSKSAILICVLSPAYIKSEWCLSELREFFDRAGQQAGTIIGERSKVFKVLKTPVPYASHPSALQGLLGYEFYETDSVSGRVRELNAQTGPNYDVRYWERFEDLAFDLSKMIESLVLRQSDQEHSVIPVSSRGVLEVVTQPESSRPLRVFLCHSSGDKPAVRDLYHRLCSDGIEPWLDEEDLLPGLKWQIEIPNAVRNSDVVLVCLSKSSVNKRGYVQSEIKSALDVADEQPDGTIFLIPLRLEECEVPERLRSFHWVNIYEDRGYEKLMRSLRARSSTLSVTDGILQ